MKHEKQARALIRKMIRRARQDWTTCVYVTPYGDYETINERQHEGEILDAVFGCDETVIRFHDMTTGRNLGSVLVVLEYDREPCEIISDYTDNEYMNRLLTHIGA
jgi:hypothetical protein